MKAMPFLTATAEAVTVEEPVLVCAGRKQTPSDLLQGWDYLQDLEITTGFRVDENLFREQTGLVEADDLDGVVLVVQVDCTTTNWRQIGRTPLRTALDGTAFVQVTVPAGRTAQQLLISTAVLLDRPDGPPRPNRAAHLRGSRLFTGETEWRVALEGDGAGFPTDAFDFRTVGMDPSAPWHLAVRPDLDMPFMKAVRLQINTGHRTSEVLLSGQDRLLGSLLFHDLLLQMLLAVCPLVREAQDENWEEDSLGYVLDGLCETHLNSSLPASCDDLASSPAEFLTYLKSTTQFLEGYKA